jgi:SNF2 family DNA or RNA helicase
LESLIELLPEYLDFVDAHSLKKGKALYQNFKKDKWKHSIDKAGWLHLTVPSESFGGGYEVDLGVEEEMLEVFCECPAYENSDECKHCVAAVFWCLDNERELPGVILEDTTVLLESLATVPKEKRAMLFTTVEIRGRLETYTLANLAGKHNYQSTSAKVILTQDQGAKLSFQLVKSKKEFYDVSIEYDLKRGYHVGCNCGLNERPGMFCDHIHSVFQYIYYRMSPGYFQKFRDFTEEKAEILKSYGLTPNDHEAKFFKWTIDYYGDLTLKEKPAFIVPKGDQKFFEHFSTIVRSGVEGATDQRPLMPPNVSIDYEIGLMFNLASSRHIGFELDAVEVREKNGAPVYKRLSTNNDANWPFLKPLDNELYKLATNLSDKGLMNWMSTQGHNYFSGRQNPWLNIMQESVKLLRTRYYNQLREHWDALRKHQPLLFLPDGKFNNKTVRALKLSEQPVKLSFKVEVSDRFINIFLITQVDGCDWASPGNYHFKSFLYWSGDTIYLPEHVEDLEVKAMFREGLLKFSINDTYNVFKTVITPLKERYLVEVPENFSIQQVSVEPSAQLHLGELNEQSLMLYPRYLYDKALLEKSDDKTEMVNDETGLKIIERKQEFEKQFFEFIRSLHPKFSTQRNNPYFYLPFSEVMKSGWFLKSIQTVQDAGYTVYGLDQLKTFRYNTNKPKFEMKTSSGNDWFDLTIEISWGDMTVPLKEIRKAIANKQTTVLLDDGTLGLLPEEWIQQYGMMLKMGEESKENKGTMRVSKRHFGIMDDLGDAINNHEVLAEIKEKKEKLAKLEDLQTSNLSKKVKAKMRPYQQSGFKWLQTLDELGWGGCLADDMGLGKTLQVIAFLQFLKEKYTGKTHLVICPTSLLYNWQGEFDKFCPTMKYHIYYGQERELGDDHFEKYDVILTSYGLARNDLEALTKFSWHYIILDESQSIKNPDAATTKAVGLLPCENRIVMSGTPVQNNTYDLYAQFNFINPGLLGSRDFFKNEFANPIDKQGDKDKAQQLRKMIYPFLMRRTKEQVAPDLPDKTETILWCEMGREQRGAYESYRKYYRDLILKKIDEVGMNNAGFYVLEGLLRLRQICDHPRLVKDEEITTEESVKSEELLREVEENTGQHKILIFSQFVEMLQIIKSELEKKKISFSYLDGSVSATNRKDEVAKFQTDESVKVFLISLKAGGVGLNLTAADYVYIVDPWWNPAAEQQAIDRTHRIGQTRKIFAYKMICKDSVEEKILKLQEKKKNLSDELVSEDAGFVKKLTRDDIDFLLS